VPHRQPERLGAAEEEPILQTRRETNLGTVLKVDVDLVAASPR
jgi:hypothetical protein